MNQPKYYGPNYDRAVLHPADGTHSQGLTLTLEGQLQARLDELHLNFALHAGAGDPPLDGTVAAQSTRAAVHGAMFELAETYPRMYSDAVPAGKTATGLAWYYWHQAETLYAFYKR